MGVKLKILDNLYHRLRNKRICKTKACKYIVKIASIIQVKVRVFDNQKSYKF